MRSTKMKYRVFMFCIWLMLASPALSYLYLQYKEIELVNDFIELNQLGDLPISKTTALTVSDIIRDEFNINESSFKVLNFNNRPFLRESTAFLLTNKEGLCGEGTRVLINILAKMGFDVTRVTLYNKNLHSSHTLVSVLINNEEFLLDSINSSQEVNFFLKQNNISTNDFHLMKYIDSVDERRRIARSNKDTELPKSYEFFFKKYWLYSYDATPFSKLFSKVGLGVISFKLTRPYKWISILAEQPYMIMFYFLFLVSLIAMFLIRRIGLTQVLYNIFK